MKNQRLRLAFIGLLLPLLIWLAWPGGQAPDTPDTAGQTHANGKRPGIQVPENGETEPRKRTRNLSQTRPTPNRPTPVDEAVLKRVNSILEQPELDTNEAALQLLAIAEDTRFSELVRAEALGHGVLLDLPVFAGMAADTQLPPDLADTLLTHVINENQDEALQIRAYKDFLNHPSPEIHDEALEMLHFVLGDDDEKEDEASLLRLADARLGELAAQAEAQGGVEEE